MRDQQFVQVPTPTLDSVLPALRFSLIDGKCPDVVLNNSTEKLVSAANLPT